METYYFYRLNSCMGKSSSGDSLNYEFELPEEFHDLYEALDHYTKELSGQIGRVETITDDPSNFGISRLEEEYNKLMEATFKYSKVRSDVKHIEGVVEDVEENFVEYDFSSTFDNVEAALDRHNHEPIGNETQINSTAKTAYIRREEDLEPKSRNFRDLEWQAETMMEEAESLLVENTS